jgi:hypothetical protein
MKIEILDVTVIAEKQIRQAGKRGKEGQGRDNGRTSRDIRPYNMGHKEDKQIRQA